MVTNGITYGASQLTSDGVSYQKKDGNLTTVKSALDELITKSAKVDNLEKKVTDYENKVHYLADKVQVGDYVAYDAGTWDNSKGKPTKQGDFGGYTIDTSKNSSVACYESAAPKYNGWRVLTVDKDSKTVTIVHAGQPECYYHANNVSGNSEASIKSLDDRAANEYKNEYAESVHAMTYEEAYNITKSTTSTNKDLRAIGAYYWLATDNGGLWYVCDNGPMSNGTYVMAFGFRPVVVLKSNVLTTGQGKDSFENTAWILA